MGNPTLGRKAWAVLEGDCREVLRTLPEASVHCVVTSPPYWALRNYGIPASIWGGDPACAHVWIETDYRLEDHGDEGETTQLEGSATHAQTRIGKVTAWGCGECGAWRGCLGLEPTPHLYVEHLVEVFAELWRVLRNDGTAWVNLGDSYITAAGGERVDPRNGITHDRGRPNRKRVDGLKSKDMVGIPWRVAFALQAEGWYLRSDVIWHKPNPMPESVNDRPTRTHEYLFLLSKSEIYFYDAEAVKERVTGGSKPRGKGVNRKSADVDLKPVGDTNRIRANKDFLAAVNGLVETRNRRTVWTVQTKAFKEAHFATFPPELVEPCIKAGTSERGACRSCGAPWARIVERPKLPPAKPYDGKWSGAARETASRKIQANARAWREAGGEHSNPFPPAVTVGWRPTCDCAAGEPVPCVVVDPFSGAGTTGLVARRLGRRYRGIEINPEYIRMSERRIRRDAPLLDLAAEPPPPPQRQRGLFDQKEIASG